MHLNLFGTASFLSSTSSSVPLVLPPQPVATSQRSRTLIPTCLHLQYIAKALQWHPSPVHFNTPSSAHNASTKLTTWTYLDCTYGETVLIVQRIMRWLETSLHKMKSHRRYHKTTLPTSNNTEGQTKTNNHVWTNIGGTNKRRHSFFFFFKWHAGMNRSWSAAIPTVLLSLHPISNSQYLQAVRGDAPRC